jgi:hypothetical protein|tara:strand:+ start:2263 stop:2994 length:732 start_codon:yes stop_codon:yes gene_type:complete
MTTETAIVSWDDVEASTSRGSSSTDDKAKPKYLKLAGTPGSLVSYKIRPVHKPMMVYKYFVTGPDRLRSVVVKDPENCEVRENHPELEPRLRYAINVIDRSDGDVKILEAAPSVFKGFKTWFDNSGNNPGGEDGGDFAITVEVPKNGDKRKTKYTCSFVKQAPFSEDELEQIKSDPGLYNLPEIYKPLETEQIEKILFDTEGATTEGATTEGATTSASSETTAAKSNDDLFDSDADTSNDPAW